MVVLWLIAAGLTGLALYKFGELRGAWTRWRASVRVLRSRRGEALGLFSGLALLVVGGALVLSVIYVLFRHHLCAGTAGRSTGGLLAFALRHPTLRDPTGYRLQVGLRLGGTAARRTGPAARPAGLRSLPRGSRRPRRGGQPGPPASSASADTAALSSSGASSCHCARRTSPQSSATIRRSASGRFSIMRSIVTASSRLRPARTPGPHHALAPSIQRPYRGSFPPARTNS